MLLVLQVLKLVANIEGGKEAEGILEYGVERIFGPISDEVTGETKGLHKERLNNVYTSHNIVPVIKSRRLKWAGHVSRMVE